MVAKEDISQWTNLIGYMSPQTRSAELWLNRTQMKHQSMGQISILNDLRTASIYFLLYKTSNKCFSDSIYLVKLQR